jgi:hypothetical protein
MGCGVEDNELRQTIQRLAHELADAHALMNTRQKKRPFGRHVFNAKELAYGLLHKLHAAQRQESKAVTANS